MDDERLKYIFFCCVVKEIKYKRIAFAYFYEIPSIYKNPFHDNFYCRVPIAATETHLRWNS